MSYSSLSRCLVGTAAALSLTAFAVNVLAQTSLADKPVFASVSVPGNLALALSVEFPTAVSNAHLDSSYNVSSTYLGYFDPNKCYDYKLKGNGVSVDHFAPAATTTTHTCNKKWSGNFLNWASMQTIDPFRWALTGGYRVVDDPTITVLEKAYASGQGGTSNFPDRSMTNAAAATIVSGATPLGWSGIKLRVQGMGVNLRFTLNGNNNSGSGTAFDPTKTSWADDTSYTIAMRVRVCDKTLGVSYLEDNCRVYSGGNYKPEGLIQQYSNQIRFSAFGYLNDGNINRDGGVLRARQKFVGPNEPVPGGDPISNGAAEWSSVDGTMVVSPNASDVDDTNKQFGTSVANSGVMNYLNKFGAAAKSYKTYDPVGELYYTALRYYRNVGNVPEYSDLTTTSDINTRNTWADGFPVITKWDDPIKYYCQKNFILGIGDVNTHADRNLPGASGSSEPGQPATVTSDNTKNGVNASTWTTMVGTMSGISGLASTSPYNGCCTNNGALMAGLAYWANTTDLRADLNTKQTVQTYWLDVLEASTYKSNNQYYLATKYGGFNVPTDFNPIGRTADIPQAWWHTGSSSDTVGGQLRPDTYYTAARPDLMVSGLSAAFADIASRLKAYSTAFATAEQKITSTGVANYSAQYDATNWSGEVVAATLSYDASTGAISSTAAWSFSQKLATQAADTGWKTGRFIATMVNKKAVPFTINGIGSSTALLLNTTYRTTEDSSDYLDYLRGDRSQEQNSTVDKSSKAYRTRTSLVGDIVNAKLVVVGPPSLNLSDASNPGYSSYKSSNSKRANVVVAATNQGMVHVIDGSLTGATAGKELFAYVPGSTFAGPTATPAVNGLQSLGNPNFVHYYMVDAPPVAMDVDFGNTGGSVGTPAWRSIVVGGMGKGGRSIYALDVTDTSSIASDADAAGKVLWEFSGTDMGYTFGEPLVTKLGKYGWVVMVASGMNNTTGKSHVYVLNARTGALIKTIDTPTAGTTDVADDGTPGAPSGMTQLTAYYPDLTSAQAEAVYAGDLRGNVWRFDMTDKDGNYPAPTKIARALDGTTPLPITTHVLPVAHPVTNRRYVTFGTGKLLAANDINSAQVQRMYAVLDGTAGKFAAAGDLPTGISFPIGLSQLAQLTDVTKPTVINYKTQAGWYMNVDSGYRIITDPAYFQGTVTFAATRPTSDDACSPTGSSRVYALDLGTGMTQFSNNAAYVQPGFAVTDITVVIDEKGNVTLNISGATTANKDDQKNIKCEGSACASDINQWGGYTTKQLNWREIPLRNANGGTL